MTSSLKALVEYSVRTKPKACVELVISCAKDGQAHWQTLFEHGLPNIVAADRKLERYLLSRLCVGKVFSQSDSILKAYVAGLEPQYKQQFFSEDALKNKDHVANHVFSQAALEKTEERLSLKMLNTLLEVGLKGAPMQQLASRKHQDVERACKGNNQVFLDFLFSNLKPVPEKLLIHVVKSVNGTQIIAALIGSTPTLLAEFLHAKVLYKAETKTREYLGAVEARSSREPSRYDTPKTLRKLA